MALKYKFKAKEEIPSEHAGLYTERDGAWVLDVEGAAEKAKQDEFRSSNVALMKERDELRRKFEGIESERVKELSAVRARRLARCPTIRRRVVARRRTRLIPSRGC